MFWTGGNVLDKVAQADPNVVSMNQILGTFPSYNASGGPDDQPWGALSAEYANKCKSHEVRVYYGLPFQPLNPNVRMIDDIDNEVDQFSRKFFMSTEIPQLLEGERPPRMIFYGIHGYTAMTMAELATIDQDASQELFSKLAADKVHLGSIEINISSSVEDVREQARGFYRDFISGWADRCGGSCQQAFAKFGEISKQANPNIPRLFTYQQARESLERSVLFYLIY